MGGAAADTQGRPAVLVTGAAGFIGTAVRRRLGPGHRLLSVDLRPVEPLPEAPDELRFQVDLGDPDAVEGLWRALRPEHARLAGVVHLAAHYDFLNRPDARYARLREGLARLLPLLARDAPAGAVFAFASSMAALERTEPGRPLRPDSPKHAGWAYPASKVATEELLARAGLPQAVVELVLAAVYSDAGELVPLFRTLELLHGRSPERFLYPAPRDRGLTYVHVQDVAEAFARALAVFQGRGGHHRFLIGQERPVPYGTLVARASQAFRGRRQPLLRVPRWFAWVGAALLAGLARLVGRRRFILPWMIRYAGEHFEFDLTASREQLGWAPRRHLEEDLDGILRMARDDRPRWLALNRARPW
jgi:nucleoside-diphosphate-sugar epimerase